VRVAARATASSSVGPPACSRPPRPHRRAEEVARLPKQTTVRQRERRVRAARQSRFFVAAAEEKYDWLANARRPAIVRSTRRDAIVHPGKPLLNQPPEAVGTPVNARIARAIASRGIPAGGNGAGHVTFARLCWPRRRTASTGRTGCGRPSPRRFRHLDLAPGPGCSRGSCTDERF
jgi:hypothetical protein